MTTKLQAQQRIEECKGIIRTSNQVIENLQNEINTLERKHKLKVVKKIPKIKHNFMSKLQPSKTLGLIIGDNPIERTAVVSKLWDYIKKHDLQDPENRRTIIADEKLLPLFKKKKVTMFDLASIVGQNLTPIK